ncbi:Spiroplasmavirus-related protein [Spiroplasma kunkelii CR2-3x]|uniref:Spiroplasmavirus-related protein n=1 Tax=Spiroplasma kunkelii CR2-3x TaxID=273035 RepID=A0A0K2JI97_SPIKU|nr:hypothetical protein [Spiroplasma kunkelii]ALA98304.1 Spiroplasmavirus-related protein [Spiroplasma kunkelii CR2-3x]
MDMKFKTTKEYKKIKRDFIKDIFLLSSVAFLVVLVGSDFLSFFIYLLILSWNDKYFLHNNLNNQANVIDKPNRLLHMKSYFWFNDKKEIIRSFTGSGNFSESSF